MALVCERKCEECGKHYFTNGNPDFNEFPYICPTCKIKKFEEDREDYLNELKKLSIEERLEKIEEILYNFLNRGNHEKNEKQLY